MNDGWKQSRHWPASCQSATRVPGTVVAPPFRSASTKYWRAVEMHITAQNAMAQWREVTTTAHNKAARKACRDLMNYVRSVSNVFHFPQRIYLAERWLRELEKEPGEVQ